MRGLGGSTRTHVRAVITNLPAPIPTQTAFGVFFNKIRRQQTLAPSVPPIRSSVTALDLAKSPRNSFYSPRSKSSHSLSLKYSKLLFLLTRDTLLPMDISRWTRMDWWRSKPSGTEFVLLHYECYRHEKLAQAMYAYPFGKETMAKAIKELVPRKDYEFFLARTQPSNEILGWVALSFDIEGNEAGKRNKYEARLELTEMYSHILKYWKADSAGEKSNV